jgi:hypothetical protein
MRARSQSFLLSTALAVILGAGLLTLPAGAQAVIKQDPAQVGSGLNSQGGQINPGAGVQAPSGSPPGMNDQSGSGEKVGDRAPPVRDTAATNEPIPSAQEARAALLSKPFTDPLPGDAPAPPAPAAQGGAPSGQAASSNSPSGQDAIGGHLSPGTSAATGGGSGGTSGSGGATAKPENSETAPGGNVAAGGEQQPAVKVQASEGDTPRLGPIGAIGQTMPAKFSKRNDILDRLPAMAWPLSISADERQQVYKAAMADKGDATTFDVDKLRTADQLPSSVALTDMHPLPQQVAGLSDLDTYAYVKSKDKVLLVTPATWIVVDVIAN